MQRLGSYRRTGCCPLLLLFIYHGTAVYIRASLGQWDASANAARLTARHGTVPVSPGLGGLILASDVPSTSDAHALAGSGEENLSLEGVEMEPARGWDWDVQPLAAIDSADDRSRQFDNCCASAGSL